MPRFLRTTLSTALAGLLAASVVVPAAHAQGVQLPGAKKERAGGKRVESDRPALYPNATRESPKPKASPKLVKQLQEMQALYEAGDKAAVVAKADEIAASPAAGGYDKAYAYQIAGNASADIEQPDKAISYFRQAIDTNALDNDSHFTTLLNMSSIQAGEGRYADALATLDTFMAGSRSDKPEHLSFRANLLANQDRFGEAVEIYKTLLAANPGDKRLLMNTVASLQQADRMAEANVLLADAHKRGMLTEPRELRTLYIGFMNDERWKDAQAVMEDGQAKGILKPGAELARDYSVLAQQAYAEDDSARAIEMYNRAAPMAEDGETYLNLAKVLEYADKIAEAKAAAQKALDKGLKKPAEARRILAL